MTSQIHTFKDFINDPDKRFKEFFSFNCDVKLNPSFSIEKYLRSGRELIRMANVYFDERDYIHSFVLYSRYVVLYCQALKAHPQYPNSDKLELSAINKQLKGIALPRAEKLKVYIKELFANEAKEFRSQAEQQQYPGYSNNQEKSKPSTHYENNNYELIKSKFFSQNEQELNELVEKERTAVSIEAGHIYNQPFGPQSSQNRPAIDRSLKPDAQTNKYNFRTIILPSDTTKKFLEIAQANTSRDIETCGILAGKLSKNVFILSHCIIPKQKGTSDTCSTEHEHEMLDIVDNNDLITLGWIHTHPSQTAFLSSIDLHTHFGYQLMIPEAIAIVCAPSYDQYK